MFWLEIVMLAGGVLALVVTWLVARSNAQLATRIEERRTRRRAEARAAEIAVSALSGRDEAAPQHTLSESHR